MIAPIRTRTNDLWSRHCRAWEGRGSLGKSSGVFEGSVEGILVRDPVATIGADVMCIEGFADRQRGDRIAQRRNVQRYFSSERFVFVVLGRWAVVGKEGRDRVG